MSIPLDTYDPNWTEKYDALNAELEKENAKPYIEGERRRSRELLKQLHEAFHAQFRTTGDYAEWMESNVRQVAESEGMPDFKVPLFPKENSVEATRSLYKTVVDRIEIVARADKNMLALDYPNQDQAFSSLLGEDDTRTTGVILGTFSIPVVESGAVADYTKEDVTYSYLVETRGGKVNICFLQLSGEGVSPINCIELLASQLYSDKFGPAVIGRGDTYYPAENLNFYIYVPPRVMGDELFMKVGLAWMPNNLRYSEPEFHHYDKVPYVLRKQAAADGLAKDPDVSRIPKRSSPLNNNPDGNQHG